MTRHLPPAIAVLATLMACTLPARAAPTQDMAELTLEQLSEVLVTSVARQPARLGSAPASLYIISGDDIRRSGARSLPEALRLAPNLQVARSDARNYAITARGFNSVFANKLLVLIDGRTVYTPLFAGVFWDVQDVLMDDVARIEVISGPGATIWGANAVNGVINVIMRRAAETRGGMASATYGADEQRAAFRYGGAAGDAAVRAYAKSDREDDRRNSAGAPVATGWKRQQAGFRADWGDAAQGLTVSGDVFDGKLHQAGTRDIAVSGANLIARYTMALGDGDALRLQAVLDHTGRDQPNAYVDRMNTVDLEAQHDLQLGQSHRLSWGAGYRKAYDRQVATPGFSFLPAALDLHWGNLFAQDVFSVSEALQLTAGLKLEHNNYTGTEVLPNLRLAWTPDPTRLLWTSLSRTVRAPSRIDRDFFAPSRQPSIYRGGPDFASETASVVELGYRAQAMPSLSYSITAFVADYDKLRTTELRPGPVITFMNLAEGRTHGVEMWSRWQPRAGWRLDAGAVFQKVTTKLKPGSTDSAGGGPLATNDPDRHLTLRSSHDLADHLHLDLNLRHVGALTRPAVPAYNELDLQLQWNPRKNVDLSLIGQNLLHRQHGEFGGLPGRNMFERSALLTATVRF